MIGAARRVVGHQSGADSTCGLFLRALKFDTVAVAVLMSVPLLDHCGRHSVFALSVRACVMRHSVFALSVRACVMIH